MNNKMILTEIKAQHMWKRLWSSGPILAFQNIFIEDQDIAGAFVVVSHLRVAMGINILVGDLKL
jgi:hypothetical protein